MEAETHRHAALFQFESHSQSFSHKDVGIMTRQESPLQFLQLPTVEVGPAPSPLIAALVRLAVATCNEQIEAHFSRQLNQFRRLKNARISARCASPAYKLISCFPHSPTLTIRLKSVPVTRL